MAIMIPLVIAKDHGSRGERDFFEAIRCDPVAKDWVCLHSVMIGKHRSKVVGEADFVVVIPHKGVLVVEIKGCSNVHTDRGGWYFGRNAEPSEDPMQQVVGNRFSLMKLLHGRCPGLRKVPWFDLVVFPYVDGVLEETGAGGWNSHAVIEAREWEATGIGSLLMSKIDEARAWMADLKPWFSAKALHPDPGQVNQLRRWLEPCVRINRSPAKVQAGEIERYTQEQFVALDLASGTNDRICFKGSAGSGKTVLAVELAARESERHVGGMVHLICFNRLLGSRLQSQAPERGITGWIGTIHSLARRMIGDGWKHLYDMHGSESMFWDEIVPRAALEAWLQDEEQALEHANAKCLVIDEFQDLTCRPALMELLDVLVEGGMECGRVYAFGDWYQDIFADDLLPDPFCRPPLNGFIQYPLRTNCRNTPETVEGVDMLARLPTEVRWTRVLRSSSGVDPELTRWNDRAEQAAACTRIIDDLREQGYAWGDIVVLSFRNAAESVAVDVADADLAKRLVPADRMAPGRILCTSIHAFKGLEAPAIIVADAVGDLSSTQNRMLLYVAMTRATSRLYLLLDGKATVKL